MIENPQLLQALLAPQSVAIVGASDNPGRAASRPLQFLLKHGFAGNLYPVNPARETVLGQRCYTSLAELPESIEHATILVGTERVESALIDCLQCGASVVSVFADGFADAGADGLQRQHYLQSIANEAGALLIGPNSTGVVATRSRLFCTTNAAFAAGCESAGRYAVLSQSGSIIGTLYSRGQAAGIDFSVLVSVGNEAQASIGQLGNLLLDDPNTAGFMLFLETLRERDELREFASRAHALGKPVVAYRVGQSDEGQQLSVSHTGALLGSGAASNSFLAASGIRRVDVFESLLEAPAALLPNKGGSAHVARPKTATVVSTTGGGGAMLVDQLSIRGVAISGISSVARNALEAEDITLGQGKLVDVTMAGTRYEVMKRVISTLIADPATGVLIIAIGSSAQFNAELAVKPVIDAVAQADGNVAPVLTFPLPHAPESLAMFRAADIPCFRTVESCAESVALLLCHSAPSEQPVVEMPLPVQRFLQQCESGVQDEVISARLRELLTINGPQSLFLENGDQLPSPLPFSYPVAVKIVSPDIPHKSDIGAVQLNIQSHSECVAALQRVVDNARRANSSARISGVLIQQMIEPLAQMLISYSVDPVAGPVVSIASGGVTTELSNNVVTHPAPITLRQAEKMIDSLKTAGLLRGYRGSPRADALALATALQQLSILALCDRVVEMELNPVMVLPDGEGVVAVDALLQLT